MGILVIVVVLAIAIWALLTQPSMVQVNGQVVTVGSGTTPLNVKYQTANRAGSNYTYTFIVVGDSTVGYSYSGSVTNHQTYTITIGYRGIFGLAGTCTVGEQTVDSNLFSTQPIIHDVSC